MNTCIPNHVVLLGLMGVGKSTIGERLARRLDRPVSDSDLVIAREQRATVRELDARLGPDGMHRLEAEHLLQALAAPGPSIVCAASSVVDDARCRGSLTAPGVAAVWLRAAAELLAARFAGGAHRPRLADDPLALLREQARERGPRFAEVAQLTIDVNERSPSDVVDEIVRSL